MGCVCSRQTEPEMQIKFDKNEGKEKQENSNGRIKESYNNFLSEFNDKIKFFGEYLKAEDFNSLITKEFPNYQNEKPFNMKSENSSSYEIKPIEFQNGNIYQGNWNKKFKMDGPGKYYLKNDKVLVEGNWEDGELKNGKIFYPNGDIYEGEMKDSLYHGKGKFKSFNDNNIYEGDFVNGEKTGSGKIIFNDETVFEGNFNKGEIKGKGKMTWKNGYEYIGEFNGFILDGKGKLTGPNGESYEGDFVNNLFHGNGKYIYKNGNEYNGEFQYGIKKGKGTFIETDKYIFEGNWDNDLPCGVGRITNWDKNGILKCTWRFGKIAEEPIYELGNEDNFQNIDLDIKPDEISLNTKELPHLVMMETDSTQYKLENSLSFLNE